MANGLQRILKAMVTSHAGLSVLDLGGNDQVGPAAKNLGMFLSTQVIYSLTYKQCFYM